MRLEILLIDPMSVQNKMSLMKYTKLRFQMVSLYQNETGARVLRSLLETVKLKHPFSIKPPPPSDKCSCIS